MTTTTPTESAVALAWIQAVDDFAEHMERLGQPSPTSAASYCARTRTVGAALDCGPWDLTPDRLAAHLDAQNWSARTRKASLVALRRFYAWSIRAGRVALSPVSGLPDGAPRRPGPLRLEPTPAWVEPMAGYMRSLYAGGRRLHTIELRRQHLTALSHTFADPWTVTADDLARYLARQDWSPEHRRSRHGSVRQFYRWAVIGEHIDRDPTLTLASVRVPRQLPRPTPDEALLSALALADERVRVAIDLGAYAGLRIGEVARLKEADITKEHLRVSGKGGHQRFVPMHPSLALTLTAWTERRSREGVRSHWLFPSPQGGHLTPQYLSRLVSEVLPNGWTHHTLRHRFATQAYTATRDLRAVQELLGHTKPETTARYAAVSSHALVNAVAGVGLTPNH